MRKYFTYNIIGMLLIFIGSSLILNSKEILKPYFEITNTPDYCGDDLHKNFELYLNLGDIVKSDSLYGYNFQISYDTNKIELNQFLTSSTLSENCPYKGGQDIRSQGIFRGNAADFDYLLIGDKPLFAISGRILSSCIDSTMIKLDYIEFTDEFSKDSIELPEMKLYIKKIDNETRYLNIGFIQDTIKSNEDSLVIVSADLNNELKLTDPICIIEGNIQLIKKETISTVNNSVSIKEIQENQDSMIIMLSAEKIYSGDLLTFEMNDNSKTEDSLKISIKTQDCECFTRISGDIIRYKYVKEPDTASIVNEEKATCLNIVNNKLVLRNVGNIKDIKIYNIYGAVKKEISNQYQNDIEISFDEIENGVYGVSLIYDRPNNGKFEKRIIVIKN